MFLEKATQYQFPNFGYIRLPEIPISKNNFKYLTDLCEKGFEEKLKNNKIKPEEAKIYADRCKSELETFKQHGLVDYFLLLYDITSWCDSNGIARGIARGSSSGSLCLYLLSITDIDPLKHNLYFSRFINEARLKAKKIDNITYISGKTAPDCDLDVSFARRQEVVNYIEAKYTGKTAKICTCSRFSGKLLIKETTKAFLGYTEEQAKELSDYVERHFGEIEKLEDTYENSKEFKKWADENQECYKIAQQLELLIKNKSRHPSGIAVSYDKIEESLPLELSSDKSIITSYDMYEIANLCIKIDILGLKNCDINREVCDKINIKQGDIDINHESIYRYLNATENYYGLFQIEEGLTKKVVYDIKPKNIDHLAACVAISRPGSYKHIDKFKNYLHNNVLESIYSPIDEILKEAGNIILFQEQINRVCIEVYKMDPVSADLVRFCIGKKDKEGMKKWEPTLYKHGKENNIPEEVTKYFWETCRNSADYLFVRGHAYSYAYMTAINTFLKVNYSKEFFLALCSMAKNEPSSQEVINKISMELKYFNIQLLKPDLIKSELDFITEDNNIRFGLSSIKGIAEKSFEKLLQFRKPHSNKLEMFLSAKQSGIGIGLLSSLIMSGALDSLFPKSRCLLCLESQTFNLLTPREQKRCLEIGKDFDYDVVKIIKHLSITPSEKPFIKKSRLETLRSKFAKYNQIYEQNKKYMDFAYNRFEVIHLGFSYSYTLKEIFSKDCPSLVNIKELELFEDREYVHFVAEVVKFYSTKSKAGKKYYKLELKDETGTINCMIFGEEKMAKTRETNPYLPKPGEIVFCKGQKATDIVFLNSCVLQDNKIYIKLSELDKENQN